ncbi:MAG: SusC/RagA family TonB-linked outer membrane protein [Candidatus Pedobacter colombiensis]|uniref:SusC/RagA family TonB-linked outer membrane protein n=1 Tax=Candidatus Pedobacter colombiensis TaxID=3121371 RepID=A0AAJ5W7J5_9SPHI|nr:SusC/RagA family TonB-linked outer membrane protein [Pedobacter sp.]WEK18641.1 MAG: SusC/RagA family TonB-linked outer membrane protein [Pedobacter sp.]
MKLYAINGDKQRTYALKKILRIMKLTIFLLITGLLQVSAAGYGQRVSLSYKNASIEEVLRQIRKQSGYDFLYSNQGLKDAKPITIKINNATIEEALIECFSDQPFTYSISGKSVVIKNKPAMVLLDPVPVKGKVTNDKGDFLQGVTVTVKGTKIKVITNANGEFNINMPEKSSILIFSCIGYGNKEVAAITARNITVQLDVAAAKLIEVQVVGYGVVEKRSNTGAVATTKPNVLGALPNNLDNALVGRMAGVQVMPSSGVPGSASAITIRGVTSINGKGNSPLIVIDGVPMYGADKDANTVNFSGRTYGTGFTGNVNNSLSQNQRETFERNPLSLINPEDIESVEVLKDAFATAIYGSRGASGVILLVTKRGHLNMPRADVQISAGVNSPFAKHKLMNGDQYSDFYTTYFAQQNKAFVFPKGINTNWMDEIEQTGKTYNATFNISNGNEKGNYYISGSYANESPYIVNNKYERYSGRVNLNQNLSKALSVGTNLTLSTSKNGALNSALLYGDAAIAAPNKPIYNEFGNYVWDNWKNTLVSSLARDNNPVGYAATTINYISDNNVVGNVFAEVKLFPWAKFKSELGVDWETSRAYSRFTSKPRTLGGLASETENWRRKWVVNNTINVNKAFENHTLNGVIGQSFESSIENAVAVTASNFPNDKVLSLNTAGTKTFGSALQQEWALVSYFTRLNYMYKGRYMAGVTYRLDGSSKFSVDRRYVGFPSFSAGWDVSREQFMQKVTFVDQLKLRGSLGLSGSDGGLGYYGNKGIYTNVSGNGTWAGDNAIVPSTPNNPDLKWETRTKYNVGADIILFKSAVNITLDYYSERTKNAILSFPIPNYLGFISQSQNVGELSNKGVEFSISTTNIEKDGFRWNTMFNITRNVNKVEKLYEKNGLTDPIALGKNLEASTGRFLIEGKSATAFYLYEWAGVNPDNGNPLWVDKNGNKAETNVQLVANGGDNNRRMMGDAAPKFYGGLDNTISYKGIEFNAFFSYAYGNKMLNGTKAYLYAYTSNDVNNLSVDMLDYWKTPGQQTNIPALLNRSNFNYNPTTNLPTTAAGTDYTLGRNTSRFLEDASYIKLRSATIAYTIKPAWSKKVGVSNLKLYVQADNVFVITKYSGVDPEVSAFGSSALQMGRDEFTMPTSRSFRLGIKVGF